MGNFFCLCSKMAEPSHGAVNSFNVASASQETVIKLGIADLSDLFAENRPLLKNLFKEFINIVFWFLFAGYKAWIFYAAGNAKTEFLNYARENVADESTVMMLIYAMFPVLLIVGAKKGERKLMVPWLVLSWLQVVLVFISLGISLLMLCDLSHSRKNLNVRMAFFLYIAAAIHTGWIYFALQIVSKFYKDMKLEPVTTQNRQVV